MTSFNCIAFIVLFTLCSSVKAAPNITSSRLETEQLLIKGVADEKGTNDTAAPTTGGEGSSVQQLSNKTTIGSEIIHDDPHPKNTAAAAAGDEETATSVDEYPNPLYDSQYKRCNIPEPGHLCDPDGVLSEKERLQIAAMLNTYRNQTRFEEGESACKQKGISMGIAFSRKPFYVMMEDKKIISTKTDGIAFELLKRWDLDNECHKAAMIVLTVKEPTSYVQAPFFFTVPILLDEVKHILAAEDKLLFEKHWSEAISNILKSIRRIANQRNKLLYGQQTD